MLSQPWLKTVVFVLLPLQPAIFAIAVGLVGFFSWIAKRETVPFGRFFLVFAALGSVGELLASPHTLRAPQMQPPSPHNQIPFWDLTYLRAWNHIDGLPIAEFARFQKDGFWRLHRINAQSRRSTEEIFVEKLYPIQEGKSYTQSFYFRHDKQFDFAFTFLTAKGHHRANTTVVDMGNGLKRAYATYQAQPGDNWVRAMDLGWVGGDWSYLEIGFAILEAGSTPSYYAIRDLPNKSLLQRIIWWIGTALMAILVLNGSRYLLVGSGRLAGIAVLLGLFVSTLGTIVLGKATWDARAMGFTTEPNLLGHQAVMMSGLVSLLVKSHWAGGIALAMAGLTVFLSGSRGALFALMLLCLAWWWGLGFRWRWAILGVSLSVLGGMLVLNIDLGRIGTAFDLQANSNKIRLQVWEVAFERLKENPLVGLGQSGFVPYYLEHRPLNALSQWIGHTHNLFLQLWVEGGIFGLLGFLVLWGVVIWEIQRRKNIWVGLILLAGFVLNMVDYTWFYSGVHYVMWVAVAWMLNLEYKQVSPGKMPG